MEEKAKNSKKKLIYTVIVLFILLIGFTYAYWQINLQQEDEDIISVGCFNLEFTTGDALELTNSYPISDEDGISSEQYLSIQLKNICTVYAGYKINLEILEGSNIDLSYIKTSLNDINLGLISSLSTADTTINNAVSAHTLFEGSLNTGETANFEFRMWLDENTPYATGNNKILMNKVTIISAPKVEQNLASSILKSYGGSGFIEQNSLEFPPDFTKVAVSQNYYDSLPDTATLPLASKENATVENGLYMTNDYDGTKTYYFRGNTINNNVFFAGYYWKILRINENGSVKMIYIGNSPNNLDLSAYFVSSVYSPVATSNGAVGYMYGTLNSSTYAEEHDNINDSIAKETIDNFYRLRIESNPEYTNMIYDTVYCNDRSLFSGSGVGTDITNYSARNRVEQRTPTLNCLNINDRFTVSDTIGNGDLTYPAGLITADEIMYAGASFNIENRNFFLYTYNGCWTMSPMAYFATGPYIYQPQYQGLNGQAKTDSERGIRPVITLKPNAEYSLGNGTSANPYIIE